MSILHKIQFIPSVQADEKHIYFYAISHVSIDAQIHPAEDVAPNPKEHQSLTTPQPPNPPSPSHPGAARVTRSSTNPHPPPPPRSLIHLEADVNAAAAEALMHWKTTRFFSELFRLMVAGVGAEADPVAYAHTRLRQNKTRKGLSQCASSLPLAMVRRAVDDFLLRRREVVGRRPARAEGMGEMDGMGWGSELGMLETEKLVRQWDSAVFWKRVDQYLELDNIRTLLLGGMARAGLMGDHDIAGGD